VTIKVLIDAMLPWRLANLFRDCGHEARHVRRLKDMGRTDALIWNAAITNGEIVITCDKDFKDIQSTFQSGKLIYYRQRNLNRSQILADFVRSMDDIVTFAASAERTMEIS
jgi:predicted nuclease of predicted toxin-antitoxin system